MPHVRVRPSKSMSLTALVVGVGFVIVGLLVIVPQFGLFGVLWTLVALGIAIYHGANVFLRRGAALYQVDVEGGDRPADGPDVAGRLEHLDELRRAGRVSEAEYQEQRARILRDL
jgi:hypothetical protein